MLGVLTLLLVKLVRAQCECGYWMDETGDYYTHAIYNNFSTYTPATVASNNPIFAWDWVVQGWGMPYVSRIMPLTIQNTLENVYIEDGNLILKQTGYPTEGVMTGRNVSVSSISSRLGDIYHGSFRTEMKVEGATGGSVAGFFWYHVCGSHSSEVLCA